MLKYLFFVISIVLLTSCLNTKQSTRSGKKENVGDIPFNTLTDNPDFMIGSDRIMQYYNFGKGLMYEGEAIALDKIFKEYFKSQCNKDETGYITVRFIVNTNGKTGRFRIYEMGTDYKPKKFAKHISSTILELVKKLNNWETGCIEGKKYAYYQYLTFRINAGTITEVLP